MSRDGQHFSKVGVQQKTVNNAKASYQFFYLVRPNDFGRYYFRVKQRWLDGYYRYTDIRSIEFTNPSFSTVSIYPNPSSGNVGLKFIAAKAGNYGVEVSNAAGQIISRKDLVVAETDYKQLGLLQKGTYYVKITEQSTQASTIHQVYVQ
ncbi:MAG: T9SS type A sorting domain-containing protein [Chitinophagaceae bacterium]|nr:MAG: T9SS type A sorting domain-containing protein [Chitinophagaceae bacterium]